MKTIFIFYLWNKFISLDLWKLHHNLTIDYYNILKNTSSDRKIIIINKEKIIFWLKNKRGLISKYVMGIERM